MSKEVFVKIIAETTTTIVLEDNESIDDALNRNVDIYLHGRGENGHVNKTDLGGDITSIEVIDL